MIPERKIVALTPVKNEAWILPLFCQSASIWADYIIIADQGSTDGSKEIASRFPKVTIIDNDSVDFDEGYMNGILVAKAREIVGNNGILFRIDADEFFTPNFDSDDWEKIRRSESGVIWHFRWLQINKNFSSYWETSPTYGAFVDDGRDYSPYGVIHARDIFVTDNSDEIFIPKEIKILHLQFIDWNRMRSKHRWYQCYERIYFPSKSAIDIYRRYHWMYNPLLPFRDIPSEWITDYKTKYGIDLNSYEREKHYWWDDKTQAYLLEHTPKFFRHIETYYTIWELLFAKGKSFSDKLLMLYLHCTRRIYNTKRGLLYKVVWRVDSFLKNKLGL